MKKQYTTEEKIEFYKAKIAALEKKNAWQQEIERRLEALERKARK